jgi:hypothetical protein
MEGCATNAVGRLKAIAGGSATNPPALRPVNRDHLLVFCAVDVDINITHK